MVRLVTLAFWAMAAASLTWWGLRLWGGAAPVVPVSPTVAAATAVADPAALARLLGAAPATTAAAPPAVNRFILLGVMASPSRHGAALIAVDGKAARAYRVGSKVDEGLVLEAVEPRKARLAPVSGAGEPMTIEMPGARK